MKLLLSGLLILAALGCSKNNGDDQSANHVRLFSQATNKLVIVDGDGKPVPGAQILIGSQVDQPFANNYVSSDASGEFMAPTGWNTEETVSIQAPGYMRAVYLKQMPKGQTFVVHPLQNSTGHELKGVTSGHNVVDYDGYIDFGIVIPAISKANFFNFDVSSFVSPETDTISIAGRDIKIPTNITLPDQNESYFITLNFNKPNYRLNFKNEGKQKVFAVRGHFPLQDLIDGYQSGKDLFDLVNLFDIQGGAIREININGASTTTNFDVRELDFSQKQNVVGPKVASDELAMAAALTPYQDVFYPTDVKTLESGQSQSLATNSLKKASLLTILKKKNESKPGAMTDRLSAAFLPFSANVKPEMIPLMANPTAKSAYDLQIPVVAAPGKVAPGAVYAVLSQVTTKGSGKKKVQSLYNIWEVYSPDWDSHIQIPQMPNDKVPTGSLRWQVTLTGLPNQNAVQNIDLGPKWLEAATHATRSSIDF